MDTRFVLHGITFAWDSNKASTNLRKHGIPFEQAAEAFFDPFLKLVEASRHEEARDAIIGMDTRWNLLFVVHNRAGGRCPPHHLGSEGDAEGAGIL